MSFSALRAVSQSARAKLPCDDVHTILPVFMTDSVPNHPKPEDNDLKGALPKCGRSSKKTFIAPTAITLEREGEQQPTSKLSRLLRKWSSLVKTHEY